MTAAIHTSHPLWRLAALTLLLAAALAAPARAEGDDDTASRIDAWIERARAKVRATASKLPPDLIKWIPRKPTAAPPAKDGGDSGDTGSGGFEPSATHFPNVFNRGGRLSAAALDRVEIGYMAGILKVCDASGRVLYTRHRPNSELVAIDSVEYAVIDDAQRRELLGALGVSNLDADARALVEGYNGLPRTKVLAVLGAIASTPAGELSSDTAANIRAFLASRLKAESDVKVHRMAVLSLALAAETDPRSVNAVLDLMDRSHNSWETFTCQQFFRYHRDEIRSWPSAWRIRARLAATGNPYGPSIAARF